MTGFVYAIGDETPPRLSRRERECLRWKSNGKTSREIAMIMGISWHTVREYVKSAHHKLDSVTSAQAVAKAGALGLLREEKAI